MMNLKVSLCLFLVLFLTAGCSKPAPSPALTSQKAEPKDPEEAALVTVANIYEAHVISRKKPPQAWSDLEAQIARSRTSSSTKATDAINKIRSLNYQMKWGVDLAKVFGEDKHPDTYVIGESPDGSLKVTLSGKIIKKAAGEDQDQDAKAEPETAEPEEKKAE